MRKISSVLIRRDLIRRVLCKLNVNCSALQTMMNIALKCYLFVIDFMNNELEFKSNNI